MRGPAIRSRYAIAYLAVIACLVLANLLIWWTRSGDEPSQPEAPTVAATPAPAVPSLGRHVSKNTVRHSPDLTVTLMPIGDTEVFVKGLRALLQFLQDGSPRYLDQAAVHFDQAFPDGAGSSPNKRLIFEQIKHAMYRAYAYERKGINKYKEGLFLTGRLSEENYNFYFHLKPEKMADIVEMQLQSEDDFFLGHLRRALKAYADDHQAGYPATLKALVPKYIGAIPLDPFCPTNNYLRRYQLTKEGRGYSLNRCRQLELGGKSTGRRMFDIHKEMKVYHMLIGDFLQPERLLTFLQPLLRGGGVSPGQIVADVGSGPGLFTFPFAEAVGPEGRVLALDINASVLTYVRYIAKLRPKLNVEVRHCRSDNVGLAAGTVDAAFVIQTYHALLDLTKPGDEKNYQTHVRPWLASIYKALKAGGRLVVQDGIDKISPQILQKQVEGVGFKLLNEASTFDDKMIAVFLKQ